LKQRLELTHDKIRPLIDLEHSLPELEKLAPLEARLAACKNELAVLDTRSVAALQAEVERCRNESNQLQAEVSIIDRHIGNLETSVRTLKEETIPRLERQVGEAMQRAQNFLALENADEDTTAEVEKEYERRIERQPVEVILQNASRYENDYLNAEQRSRDRLREAKQGYSLRYDFGYDDLDDAARFLAERDKLVKSELPQYEAQIATQRAQAEQELVENFIHRLREQIEDARQQLAYLNSTLAGLRFGGERFEFITQPAPGLRLVYDMIMDSQNILGDSLFESDFRQKHQQGWDLLFERLTVSNDTQNQELHELQDYRNYLQYEIVFTQMTKMDVFAGKTGRDHVSDLDFTIFHNHPVNQQFYQFPFLFKGGILQTDVDTTTEILNRSGQAHEFLLPVHLITKLLLQVFQTLMLAFQVSSSPLIFRQRDNAIQVSFGKPIQLSLKGNLPKAQVFAPGLELLRQPGSSLGSM
jgi:FtsZ-binding cell division protein ZapB